MIFSNQHCRNHPQLRLGCLRKLQNIRHSNEVLSHCQQRVVAMHHCLQPWRIAGLLHKFQCFLPAIVDLRNHPQPSRHLVRSLRKPMILQASRLEAEMCLVLLVLLQYADPFAITQYPARALLLPLETLQSQLPVVLYPITLDLAPSALGSLIKKRGQHANGLQYADYARYNMHEKRKAKSTADWSEAWLNC